MVAQIFGLSTNSVHGIHIHEFGDLSKDDGTASASHYNPHKFQHALPLTANRHMGDMVN